MKKTIKKLTSSIIVGSLIAGAMPINVFAEDSLNVMNLAQEKDSILGSADLFTVLDSTAANTLVMDLSALTLLKQKDIDLDDNDLLEYQEKIRKYVDDWLNDLKLKDQLFQTSADINGYNNKIQSFYEMLAESAKQNDSDKVKAGLSLLQSDAVKYKEHVDQLIKNLTSYRNETISVITLLNDKTEQIINSITDDYGLLQNYHDQIKSLQQDLENDLSEYEIGAVDKLWIAGIVGAAVSFITANFVNIKTIEKTEIRTPLLTEQEAAELEYYRLNYPDTYSLQKEWYYRQTWNFNGRPYASKIIEDEVLTKKGRISSLAIGGVFAAIGYFNDWSNFNQGENFNQHIEELEEQVEQLSKTQQEATLLNLFKDQANSFADMIRYEIISLLDMSSEWKKINEQLANLMEQVENEDLNIESLMLPSLDNAKKDWQSVSEFADVMYIHVYDEATN